MFLIFHINRCFCFLIPTVGSAANGEGNASLASVSARNAYPTSNTGVTGGAVTTSSIQQLENNNIWQAEMERAYDSLIDAIIPSLTHINTVEALYR